jgi:AcrR family transcriptional regulator
VDERRFTPKGKERRAQILEHAAKLFADRGYHLTSVADIVAECKVGKGVFYWYFESKESLFTEIIRETQLSLRRHQARAIGSETDPLKRMENGLYATMEWYDRNRHVFSLFRVATAESAFTHLITDGAEVGISDTMRHVKDGIASGQIHDGDPLMITYAIVGVTQALAHRFLAIPNLGVTPHEVAAEATEFVIHGLGHRTGERRRPVMVQAN